MSSDHDRQHDRDASEPERTEEAGPGETPEGTVGTDGGGRGESTGGAGTAGAAPGSRPGTSEDAAEDGPDAGAGAEEAGEPRDGPGAGGWSSAISEMQNLVGDVVGEVLEGVRGAAGHRFPRIDMVRRSDGDYVVLVDLPGVSRDAVKVTTLGGELTISGERPRPELSEGSEVLRTERGYGNFRRTLRLPPDIREEEVSAELDGGVLEIRLPRKSPSDARTVDIG